MAADLLCEKLSLVASGPIYSLFIKLPRPLSRDLRVYATSSFGVVAWVNKFTWIAWKKTLNNKKNGG